MSSVAQFKSGGLVTFKVKSAGSAIPDSYQIYSISVDKAINRISSATIALLDGSASNENFPVSASKYFEPGVEISVEAGYDNKDQLIFSGIVTKLTLRVDDEVGSGLEVVCKDKAVKMTIGRKSACFKDMTDSDVISKLIGQVSGVSSSVASTSAQIPELVQYYCSDWDFMLTRAEINGLIVSTLNNKVSVFKHDANTSPVLKICYGQDMYSIHAELDSVTQLGGVKASGWDYKNQKLITAKKSNNVPGPGNLSSKKLSEVIGLDEYELQTTAALETENLSNWAQAQMLKSEYSKIVGDVSCQGSSLIEPGFYITLAGLGGRFNGNHLVSCVVHRISEGNWVSEINFGLSPNWFIQEIDVVAPSASGLLPGVEGLYNGTVKKNYEDTDSEYRILVDLPLFDPTGEGIWARLTNFYSTSGEGVFFIPEVGDEVIVGFLNNDPRYPVILGSVYSSKKKPFSEFNPDEKNSHKAIVTKSDLRIVFDDENKVLTITTPGKNTAILDDQNKKISITDENQNSIVMSESGIEISSPKTITIKADEKVEISGANGITIQSESGSVETTGMSITQTADTQFSATGSETASVTGGEELSLSATVVMIN